MNVLVLRCYFMRLFREKKTSKYSTKKVQTNIITNKVNDKRRGNTNNESDLCVKKFKRHQIMVNPRYKSF